MFQILLAEDNRNTSKFLELVLKNDGYEVHTAFNGKEALEVLYSNHIDLIVLDVMMPELDGIEFSKQIRSCGNMTPIIMVTAKQLPEDIIKGFEAGTDDYITKPVNETELLLRIKALLRRARIASEHKLVIGDVTLEYDSLTVSRGKENYTLPQKEFYLLYKLLSYPNKIFTRIQLMDEIWGMDSNTVDTTVNVHINRIRNRFRTWEEFEIIAIRGIGYKAVIKQ